MTHILPRIPYQFTSADGTTTVVTFPKYEFEAEHSQQLLVPELQIAGVDYGYDQLGTARGIKQSGQMQLRFAWLEDGSGSIDRDVAAMKAGLDAIGRGRLWTRNLPPDGYQTLQWCWARPIMMPTLTFIGRQRWLKTAALTFRLQSDFYSESLAEDALIIGSDPQTVTINNPGTERVLNGVFILEGTYTNPIITNLTNGYSFESTRDGFASSDWLRFGGELQQVEFSDDAGYSYIGDFDNVTLPTGQVQLMILEPGDNLIQLVGCNGATLVYGFYPAFPA